MAGLIPEGVAAGSDTTPLVVGEVRGLDVAAGMVQVSVSGSDPVWLPAAPFIYVQGGLVRVRRSASGGGRFEYCEGPVTAAPAVVTGKITAVSEQTVTVSVLDGSYQLMFASSTYNVGDSVLVLRHPTGFGVPQAVLGLAGLERPAVNPGGGQPNPPQLQSRQAVIGPQDSGSFRSSYGRWDSWNAGRYGGVRALWQGDAYGSGPMVGWAGYGEQMTNLRAASIDNIWVDVVRSDSSVTAGRSVLLQGSPSGSRPGGEPAGVGEGASAPNLTPGQGARVRLPSSTYEAWRTGGIRGLRTAGGDYLAVYGADRGGAMALTVQYRVSV